MHSVILSFYSWRLSSGVCASQSTTRQNWEVLGGAFTYTQIIIFTLFIWKSSVSNLVMYEATWDWRLRSFVCLWLIVPPPPIFAILAPARSKRRLRKISTRQKSHQDKNLIMASSSSQLADMQQDKIEARMHSTILYCTTVRPQYAPNVFTAIVAVSYLTPKLVHRTMVNIVIILHHRMAIEQYNNNDQARIIVATWLLWYIVAMSCVNWSYWVHLLNATALIL